MERQEKHAFNIEKTNPKTDVLVPKHKNEPKAIETNKKQTHRVARICSNLREMVTDLQMNKFQYLKLGRISEQQMF